MKTKNSKTNLWPRQHSSLEQIELHNIHVYTYVYYYNIVLTAVHMRDDWNADNDFLTNRRWWLKLTQKLKCFLERAHTSCLYAFINSKYTSNHIIAIQNELLWSFSDFRFSKMFHTIVAISYFFLQLWFSS